MVRSNLIRYEISGLDGIDQQADKAPGNSLADARNVWAPDGKIIVRPGYEAVGALAGDITGGSGEFKRYDFSADTLSTGVAHPFAAAAGTYNLRTGSAELGDAVVHFPDLVTAGAADISEITGMGIVEDIGTYNTDASGMYVEYYTTSGVWKKLNHWLVQGDPATPFTGLGDGSFTRFRLGFKIPSDIDTTSPSGGAIRYTFLGDTTTTPTAMVTNSFTTTFEAGTSTHEVYGLLAAEFADRKANFIVYNTAGDEGYSIRGTNSLTDLRGNIDPIYELGEPVLRTEAPTIAVNPEFNEAFIATGGTLTVRANLDYTDDFYSTDLEELLINEAQVERRDSIVGENAVLGKNLIVQDSNWPHAKYISFFRGRLWTAGHQGLPFRVQWSAASPGHKVWPSLNFENLMENDNSPITGMHPLGEHMIVFKQDSIWMMVFNGLNEFEQPEFLPRQVVAGVGCVANSSIQEVRGNLIFLSEDGIYTFDGTPLIKKISDPILDTIKAIDPARRPFSSSAHWRKNSLYLLSLSTDGDGTTNDITIVYDYKNGSWWLWDNIDAQHWLIVEGSGDNEELYFGDSGGAVYRFDSGRNDHGSAIQVSVLTQRMDYRKNIKRRIRQVELTCSNKTTTADFKILANDAHPDDVTAVTVPFTDSDEINWVDLDWGSGDTDSWSRGRRRARRAGVRVDYDWFQIEVTHNTKDQPFELGIIDVGAKSLGRR